LLDASKATFAASGVFTPVRYPTSPTKQSKVPYARLQSNLKFNARRRAAIRRAPRERGYRRFPTRLGINPTQPVPCIERKTSTHLQMLIRVSQSRSSAGAPSLPTIFVSKHYMHNRVCEPIVLLKRAKNNEIPDVFITVGAGTPP
jgi:hypothetical protein